jgi:hypothetical protein
MNETQDSKAFGSGGHKAVFDISVAFRTELAADDNSARKLIDALTDYIRSKAPGSSEPTVSISERNRGSVEANR